MAGQEPSMVVRMDDVSVDEEGKVTIQNPAVAQAMAAIVSGMRLTPHPGHSPGHSANNCFGGNCTSGCAKK
ncbi:MULTISPECIES: hypothetical protein [Nonomuraea]|uniref:Uncharacterized protein n=2 Tax=Nonomuraea TaxID=83681 RepID=A0A7W5Y9C8_9ACTN|nr:hypothetical protein [Nonomuraea dietziae]MBB3729558.1 hypothetical protein [Nonomuraea dietziae]